MQFTFPAVAATLALALAVGQSHATIIDFEDVAIPSGQTRTQASVTSRGFLFTSSTNHVHRNNDFPNPPGASNGTTVLGTDNSEGSTILTMSQVGGGAFNLGSLDMAEHVYNINGDARVVRLIGNIFGGGTVQLDLALDGVNDGAGGAADFQNFIINFFDVTSITFTAIDGAFDRGFALDNLNTEATAVPEPGSLALLALGLVGLASMRKRQQA